MPRSYGEANPQHRSRRDEIYQPISRQKQENDLLIGHGERNKFICRSNSQNRQIELFFFLTRFRRRVISRTVASKHQALSFARYLTRRPCSGRRAVARARGIAPTPAL